MNNKIPHKIDLVIVEDNQRYLDELALLLSRSSNITVKGCYLNG